MLREARDRWISGLDSGVSSSKSMKKPHKSTKHPLRVDGNQGRFAAQVGLSATGHALSKSQRYRESLESLGDSEQSDFD